jgi:uncharacterized Zn-binding protein involved in type VI secretion
VSTDVPHKGGPILEVTPGNVQSNGAANARATDTLTCHSGKIKNYIITGAATVWINGKPAARVTDKTLHADPSSGEVMEGSCNVIMGSKTVGATLGNPAVAKKACEDAKKTRKYKNESQSEPNNCNQEAGRQVINQMRQNALEGSGKVWDEANDALTESTAYQESLAGQPPEATPTGMSQQGLVDFLGQHNVGAETQPFGSGDPLDAMVPGVAEGKGVFAPVNATELNGIRGAEVPHTVLVTGVEFDENCNITKVIVNDTGKDGQPGCGKAIPADRFRRALLKKASGFVQTKLPVWIK